MAVPAAKQRFSAGPRLLMLATALAIALGVVLIYAREGNQPSYLFFFFLPIAAVSVVLGKIVGLVMALVTITVTLVPSIWLGADFLVSTPGLPGETWVILTTWAVFLIATAYLVGWVSERGGSLSFAQGIGGQAIRAIELERKRTGQDIHDGIAQYAAAAFIETEVLADMTAEADPRMHMQVERVKQSLGMLVTEARAMIGNLRPPALGSADFADTFSTLVKSFETRTGIVSHLELEGDFGGQTDSARISVYRIAQEALTNIERHSGATVVRIWARAGRGGVDLIVSDNGQGFDSGDVPAGEGDHYGLAGMRERAEYLGGRLTIRSNPGEGTTVIVHIPRYRGGGSARA